LKVILAQEDETYDNTEDFREDKDLERQFGVERQYIQKKESLPPVESRLKK
jgi:hypothetical protein